MLIGKSIYQSLP